MTVDRDRHVAMAAMANGGDDMYRLSKRITKKLRHQGRDLQMRPDGFVEISTLSTRMREPQERVEAAVHDNRRLQTHRYGTRWWVRAVGKHSTDAPVDPDLLRLSPEHCFEHNPPGPAVMMGTAGTGAGYVGHGDLPPVDAPPAPSARSEFPPVGQQMPVAPAAPNDGSMQQDTRQVPMAPAAPAASNGPSGGRGGEASGSDGTKQPQPAAQGHAMGTPGPDDMLFDLGARIQALEEENKALRAENNDLRRQLQASQ
ncbi:unnamed protein product [Cladocopium goreaui]|uniref:2'-phosphotransferase n=1 Tax=Cladocopium goreaui TaxID=2562237 RepID=A0A9P1CNN4_9DINO|nr:unnamed protein product [Cladocopium goreaui]